MHGSYCLHFTFLPRSMRVAYTLTLLVLGIGYMFAMVYTFESHAGRDGKPMLSVDDLIIAYSGSKADTQLEAALKGPMSDMLPRNEATAIIAWVRSGAESPAFESDIVPIFKKRCQACHDGSNPHIPDLRTYPKVLEMVTLDKGMDIFTLVRVSHIHLFGITFIFFIVSFIFCHAYLKPDWLKTTIIAIPFLAIIADIASWYLTKVFSPFAWVVMVSGAFMGICFAIEWVISIYQMWFYEPKVELIERKGVLEE